MERTRIRHIGFFEGIGGFSIAAEWMGWDTTEMVEIDPFCQKILKKRFPNAIIHGDIKTYNGEAKEADIVTGGFPCQPFSFSGKRMKALGNAIVPQVAYNLFHYINLAETSWH
jgi:DNA (cytosine-5)-methyltransferase 1